ncbi:MAG: hypothetical protein L6R38_003951 [Xanthoria sp. 2 TBL-2021]|nr:MAG: hypothetical protein L6R38_003951 [Xanthoria sp. 2 TBL-2021]
MAQILLLLFVYRPEHWLAAKTGGLVGQAAAPSGGLPPIVEFLARVAAGLRSGGFSLQNDKVLDVFYGGFRIYVSLLGENGEEIVEVTAPRHRSSVQQDCILYIVEYRTDARYEMKARRPLFHEILFNSTLPPLEKSIPRLGLEATLIVIAGSGTVGIALTQLHYQLLSHPDKFAQLKKELHGCHVDSDITWQELKKLPYLTACIDEILRISHTTTHRLARVASEGGLQSKQYHIPAGEKNTISMSTYLTHTDPSLFPDPHAFIPERWLLPEGKALSKYVNPFSKGPRICLGIE